MKIRFILIVGFCIFTLRVLVGQAKELAVGFYNLENLFDTFDDPNITDEEFTPAGTKNWTLDKYNDKLSRLSKVIRAIESELGRAELALLGVCEIENQKVLEDLVRMPAIANRYFKIVHYDSKDQRGVDVALIYQPKHFTVLSSRAVPVPLPEIDGEKRITRDVLLVKGLLENQQKIYVMVNHWPSRRGGEDRSQLLRMAAAQVNKELSDSIRSLDPNAYIVLMGDLNDNPDDPSLTKVLLAQRNPEDVKPSMFFNPFYQKYLRGEGSTAHNDSWSLFDQIIFSSNWLQTDQKNKWILARNQIFRKDFMIEKSGHYKYYPKRTFSGDAYNYGYSDHFPVYCILKRE